MGVWDGSSILFSVSLPLLRLSRSTTFRLSYTLFLAHCPALLFYVNKLRSEMSSHASLPAARFLS